MERFLSLSVTARWITMETKQQRKNVPLSKCWQTALCLSVCALHTVILNTIQSKQRHSSALPGAALWIKAPNIFINRVCLFLPCRSWVIWPSKFTQWYGNDDISTGISVHLFKHLHSAQCKANKYLSENKSFFKQTIISLPCLAKLAGKECD